MVLELWSLWEALIKKSLLGNPPIGPEMFFFLNLIDDFESRQVIEKADLSILSQERKVD